MVETITIDRRFNGPPDSGNGGYVGGKLAAAMEANYVSVSLRMPPPLDQELVVARDEGGLQLHLDDGTVVAIAERATVDIELPPCPSYDEVVEAQPNYAGFAFHALPTCFVCGPSREEGDGLRIFASPLGDIVAAPWTPTEDLAEGGEVRTEFVWAALDCPGYFAVIHAMGSRGEKILTARMAVEQVAPVNAGDPHIIVGWQTRSEGRKHWAGTALFDVDGALKAKSEALWIQPRSTT